ncbi:hypothetical protein R3P38DRAFT_2910926 [Favolaschia claudopus]|uniref:Uncharacterized protein n=1 Tax=Favolaschia claudopus TaxID=2862362 RepID=A0AAW0CBQ8_9AGAR
MQDGVKRVLTPEDGVCKTPRGMVHSLEGYTDEEFIIEETSTNEELSEQKTYFFRNLAAPGITKSPLGIMQVLYHGDGYPKFPTGLRWLESPMMTFFGGYLAPALGYKIPDPRLQLDRKSREKKKNY